MITAKFYSAVNAITADVFDAYDQGHMEDDHIFKACIEEKVSFSLQANTSQDSELTRKINKEQSCGYRKWNTIGKRIILCKSYNEFLEFLIQILLLKILLFLSL